MAINPNKLVVDVEQLKKDVSGKQATITGAATTITTNNLTANKMVGTDTNGKITALNTSADELDSLSGITGNVQEQLDEKVDMFETPNRSTIGYTKIAEMTTNIENTGATLKILANGAGTVDNQVYASDLIDFGTRGAPRLRVTRMVENRTVYGKTIGFKYGLVTNETTGLTELWLYHNQHSIKTRFLILNNATNFNNNIIRYGILEETTTEPAGIEYTDLIYIPKTTETLNSQKVVITDTNSNISTSPTTATEIGYVNGVTSPIQTQLNGKQATITGGATTITGNNLTANRALLSDTNGKVAVSAVTNTELGYLSGATSALQTQINGKQASATQLSLLSGVLTITSFNDLVPTELGLQDGQIKTFKADNTGDFATSNTSVGIILAKSNNTYTILAQQSGATDMALWTRSWHQGVWGEWRKIFATKTVTERNKMICAASRNNVVFSAADFNGYQYFPCQLSGNATMSIPATTSYPGIEYVFRIKATAALTVTRPTGGIGNFKTIALAANEYVEISLVYNGVENVWMCSDILTA